jgi:acyl-CoA thioester hydrolase
MSEPVFRYTHRVTYAECTVGNHIYHSRYLDILEAARGALFRDIGSTFLHWQEQDTIFPVVECRLRYKAPARYDDVLTVETRVTFAQGARLAFAYRIQNQNNLLILEGETDMVCTTLPGKPKRLPGELVEKLQRYRAANA